MKKKAFCNGLIFSLFALVVFAGSAQAAPLSLLFTRIGSLSSTGTPGVLGYKVLEVGSFVSSDGMYSGHFMKEITPAIGTGLNQGLVTITVFWDVSGSAAPSENIVLMGTHDFSSGDEKGGISATSSFFGVSHSNFVFYGASNKLVFQ